MQKTAPAALSAQSGLSEPAEEFQAHARRVELNTYARVFPWTCFTVVLATAIPTLVLDPQTSIYSPTIFWTNSITAVLALAIGIWSLNHRTAEPDGDARAQIRLGGLLLFCMAVNNALLLIDTAAAQHAGAAVLTMISVALIYPRVAGLLLVSLPQLVLVLWLAEQTNWAPNWSFAFFVTLGGTLVALAGFYTRKINLQRNHSLLAERASMIEALRKESIERTLLQERVLTERTLSTLGRLAGGIAHDLNNILVPILGNAAMLEESVQTSNHQRQAREVMRAAGRARSLTQQLSYFATRGNAAFETLELNQTLTELSPIVWRAFPQGIDIDLRVPEQAIYLHASRMELQDLLTNLLLDAGNAAPSGGTVVVTVLARTELPEQFMVTPNREFCLVTIEDGAAPLSESQRTSLLHPDHKLDGNSRGIGLLGARTNAEALGGHIDIGASSGGGNTFRVFLPLLTVAVDEPTAIDTKVSAAVAPEVLVVDDERAVRRVTVQLLQRAGFIVRDCPSGEAALEEITSHLPDVIVMDLRMPGMGGRAATESIRETNPNLPIVICTGYTGDAEGWLAKLTHTALLQKPYDARDLIDAVKMLLQAEVAGG